MVIKKCNQQEVASLSSNHYVVSICRIHHLRVLLLPLCAILSQGVHVCAIMATSRCVTFLYVVATDEGREEKLMARTKLQLSLHPSSIHILALLSGTALD